MENIKENPLGKDSISKLLKSMAIPAIAANITNAMYNIVDQIFIGQGVGYLGNAATTIAFPITTICLSIGVMLGIGTAANFNLSLGRKDEARAKKVVGTSALSVIFSGILLSILIQLFLEPLMRFFGATDEILPFAMEYTSITVLGLPFYLFTMGINPLVRADRSPKYAMTAVIIGAVINIILDFVFIFIFKLGISGAAWATVISQFITMLILVAYYRNFKSFEIKLSDFKFEFNILKSIIGLGIASFIFQISTTIIQITTNNMLNIYGEKSIYGSDITIAASGIVSKVNTIFVLIILGIVQGAQPIISYNYGAKNYDRVKNVFKLVIKYSTIISLIFFTIFQLFPKNIISIFGAGSLLYFDFSEKYMRIFMSLIFINGVQIATTTFFPSIGKAKKGATISFVKQIVILLPLLIFLPKFLGVYGVVYSIPIADFIAFVMALLFVFNEFKIMSKAYIK